MPKAPTAKLLNAKGRVTLHACVRLAKRGRGRERSIYPIYRCTETGAERPYGCLPSRTSCQQLQQFFPGIPLSIEHFGDQAA